jgi:hypothetical protein
VYDPVQQKEAEAMQTVTVQDPSAVVSVPLEPVVAVTPAAPHVNDEYSSFGEFQCEWALGRADQ